MRSFTQDMRSARWHDQRMGSVLLRAHTWDLYFFEALSEILANRAPWYLGTSGTLSAGSMSSPGYEGQVDTPLGTC